MSNMSYCRFRNTYEDVQDCFNAINNCETIESKEEIVALKSMIYDMYEFFSDNALINSDGELDEDGLEELIDGMTNSDNE